MNIPGALKPYVVLFQALDGHGQVWSPSGQFLGLLSRVPHNPNSIINPYGPYGSSESPTSIQNPQGLYGGSQGSYSPYNLICINPPVIFYQGHPLLLITRNLNIFTNGLNLVDPDLILTIYEELSNSRPEPISRRSEMVRLALRNITQVNQGSKTSLKYSFSSAKHPTL
jgi:hypothetical protein